MGRRRNTHQKGGARHSQNNNNTTTHDDNTHVAEVAGASTAEPSDQEWTRRQPGVSRLPALAQPTAHQKSRKYIGGRVSPQPPAPQPTEWQVAHGIPSETIREDVRRRQQIQQAGHDAFAAGSELSEPDARDEVMGQEDTHAPREELIVESEEVPGASHDDDARDVTEENEALTGAVEDDGTEEVPEKFTAEAQEPTELVEEDVPDELGEGHGEPNFPEHDDGMEDLIYEDDIERSTAASQEQHDPVATGEDLLLNHDPGLTAEFDISEPEGHVETAFSQALRDHEAPKQEEQELDVDQPQTEIKLDLRPENPADDPETPESFTEDRDPHFRLAMPGVLNSDDDTDGEDDKIAVRQPSKTGLSRFLVNCVLAYFIGQFIVSWLAVGFYKVHTPSEPVPAADMDAGDSLPVPTADVDPGYSLPALPNLNIDLHGSVPGTVNLVDLTLHSLSKVTAVARYEEILMRISLADSKAALRVEETLPLIKSHLARNEDADIDRQDHAGQLLSAYFRSRDVKLEAAKRTRSRLSKYRTDLSNAYRRYFDGLLFKIPTPFDTQGKLQRERNVLCNTLDWKLLCDDPPERKRRDALLAFAAVLERSTTKLLAQVQSAKKATKGSITPQLLLLGALEAFETEAPSFASLASAITWQSLSSGQKTLTGSLKMGRTAGERSMIASSFEDGLGIGFGEYAVYSWIESQLEQAVDYWKLLRSELKQDFWGEHLQRSWNLDVLSLGVVESSNALNKKDFAGQSLSHWEFFGEYLSLVEPPKA